MRFPIGLKIFGIAVGLLILMAAAALLSMRMTRTVDGQLGIIDQNYFPAYVALAQANIRSVEESAYVRRLLLALADRGGDTAKLDQLRQQVSNSGKTSGERVADARQYINRQIADPLDFDDNIALARLDEKIAVLQEERQHYESVLAKLLTAAESGDKPLTGELLGELDDRRDEFDHKIDMARNEMRRLASAAIVGTRDYQRRVVAIGIALLAIAAALGITLAAAITLGLVRPVRRLLLGTAAVEHGAPDTIVPITSRDEIGSLTQSFNSMVGELRAKAQIRDTFGKYVDPRIVAGWLDRPEVTDAKGSRREASAPHICRLPIGKWACPRTKDPADEVDRALEKSVNYRAPGRRKPVVMAVVRRWQPTAASAARSPRLSRTTRRRGSEYRSASDRGRRCGAAPRSDRGADRSP